MSSRFWYFRYTISLSGMQLVCRSCHIFFADALEGRIDVFLPCVIAKKMAAGPERRHAGGADPAEWVEHGISLKGVQLDASVRKLYWKWGRVPYPGCRLGREFPNAFGVRQELFLAYRVLPVAGSA